MIFIDASALVAIIAGEADADELADRIEGYGTRFCSAISIWETVAALCRSHRYAVLAAGDKVAEYSRVGRFTYVPIGATETELALDAYARYGKGRNPTGLNMGDCFAYACAKANKAKLLFKGDDFAKTDIERA